MVQSFVLFWTVFVQFSGQEYTVLHPVREGSSPSLVEIVCRVLANDSRGIISGHLSVDSSQLGYRIGIEVQVSSGVGDEILGSLQESLEDSI